VELQGDLGAIQKLDAVVYGVSVDPLATSAALANQLHLGFPILVDPGHQLGSAFGDYRVASGMDMGPVDNHAIFVLDAHGHIRWKQLAASSMHVPDQDVIAALQRS
jgi:peroxiredoxin